MIKKFIGWLGGAVVRHTALFLGGALLLSVLALFAMSTLKLNADLLALLPENKQSVKNLKKLSAKFGGIGYLLLGVECAPDKVESAKEFVRIFSGKIAAGGNKLGVRYVDYRMPRTYFEKRVLLHLEPVDLWKIYHRLKKKIQLEKKLANPFYIDLIGEKYRLDFSDIEKKYKAKGRSIPREYYVSKNKRMIVIFVKPSFMSARLGRSKQLIDAIKKIEWQLKAKDPRFKEFVVSYSGRYQKKIDETSVISNDLYVTSLVGLGLVVFMILFYFRRWTALPVIAVPLVMGVVWAFGLAALMIGHINIITGFLIAILLGLGIDFGIHLLTRYFEERNNGSSMEKAISVMLLKTGRAAFTAAVTTGAAFFVLVAADFKGFSEFGLIAGFGIICCFLAMVVVVPALIALFERMRWLHFEGRKGRGLKRKRSRFRFALPLLLCSLLFFVYSVSKIGRIPFEYDFSKLQAKGIPSFELEKKIMKMFEISLTPSVVIAKTAKQEVAIYNAFEKRRKALNREFAELKKGYLLVEKTYRTLLMPQQQKDYLKLATDFSARARYYTKLGQGAIRSGIYEKRKQQGYRVVARALRDAAEWCKERGQYAFSGISKGDKRLFQEKVIEYKRLARESGSTVDFINTLHTYIPRKQAYKMRILRLLRILLADEALKAVKGRDRRALNLLRGLVAVKPVTRANLPWEIRRSFMGINPQSKEIFMQIFPIVSLSDGNNIKRYAQEIVGHTIRYNGSSMQVSASGESIIFNDILELIAHDGVLVMVLASVAVFLLVLFDFKRLSATLLVLVPLMIGVVWMFGLMALFGIRFNFMNVVVLPIIVGIGIDHGVHILHRYQEEGAGYIPFVVRSTGTAVFVASLTTMVGFSALLWASHRGLNSVGQVALIGIGSTFFVAVTVLPAILQLKEYLIHKRKKRDRR